MDFKFWIMNFLSPSYNWFFPKKFDTSGDQMNHAQMPTLFSTKFRWVLPGSLQILVSLFFVFGNLGCVIFFTMVSVCKARQARLLKNVNKHFHNFVGQNQRKTKNKMGWKAHLSVSIETVVLFMWTYFFVCGARSRNDWLHMHLRQQCIPCTAAKIQQTKIAVTKI